MVRLPRPLSSALLAALLATACNDAPITPPTPEPPPEVDPCAGLPPLALTTSPTQVRVAGVALLSASGGSGYYRFRVEPGGSSGQVSGDRFVAGPTPGTDQLVLEDQQCPGAARASVQVVAGFEVSPARAQVRPGTSFQVEVKGLLGTPTFTLVRSDAVSTLSPQGLYAAGAGQGVDLVRVRDGLTGDEALLEFEVRADARLSGDPARLALPAGSSVPLVARGGSDRVRWSKVSGPGSVEGARYVVEAGASGVAELEAKDDFTGDTARVSVRVLDELKRPVQAHGRVTDVANVVTADFDGDGIPDVAVGQRESDLARPQGGAVFIFKGSATGLPEKPTWVLTGDSDTAQFGDTMAAGDLDGDGKADLAVSAPGADVTIGDSGAVYLYRFEADGPVAMRPPLAGVGRGSFGAGLTIADADGDGDLDLLVGSPLGDLAGTGGFSRRGTLDIFLLTRGQPVPELPAIRLGGSDLEMNGAVQARSNTEFGRAVVSGDLNGDGREDIVSLSKVTRWNTDGSSAGVVAQAVSVHLARPEGARFRASPDVYVLPANFSDSNEGSWRLGILPAEGTRPPLLLVLADRADSPDLRLTGGVQSGPDSGGAYLFDLSAQKPTGEPAANPPQLKREDAFARIYGEARSIAAGRSWAMLDVDDTPGSELLLGAPYSASTPAGGGSVSLGGKVLAYPLATLTRGAVLNKPLGALGGVSKADVLGVGLATWNVPGRPAGLVAFAGRASTEAGAFTGRVDAFVRAGASLAEWTRTAAPVPAKPSVERFGEALLLAKGPAGRVLALVGAPGFSGPAVSGDGSDLSVGRAYVYETTAVGAPSQVVEGVGSPFSLGRNVGADVTLSDFNGDGRPDLVIGAPTFVVPGTPSRATEVTPLYATERAGCVLPANLTMGAVMVSLGQTDGTFKPAYRLWTTDTVPGCTPTSSSDTRCQRRQVGRGVVGGFDFNGDGKQDIGALRNNGFEVFLGRAPDDASLAKLTMGCDPAYSSPIGMTIPAAGAAQALQQTSAPLSVGDLDKDGCDDVAWRYADGSRSGVVFLFGHDAGGTRCGGRTQPAWVRLAADGEVGMNFWGLGLAMERVGRFLDDGKELLAISATGVPYDGVTQPVVLLYDVAELAAKRPASGEALVPAVGTSLTPTMLVHRSRAVNFGRALAGGTDLTGDGVPDLVVAATGASVASDGGGAVFLYAGGKNSKGALTPLLTVVGDVAERAAFGQDLSLWPGGSGTPPLLLIGAPTSYRTGTQNGTAFTLPLGF
ncbi:FG-GAP-like repeat-containing protein [Myxococcaceae bacterium GXIMD 01537]